MNLLFYKMRTGKKGQIIAVLTVALVVFIIAAFLVVNLGKNKIQDSKLKNAAQAGVLAGGSAASVLLNSMANINDNMILNFAGFTFMMEVLLISWTIDYVKTILKAYTTYTPYNVSGCIETLLAIGTLCLTTATIALLISGATKIGNALYKMITELNDKLPKNSRDSARQYVFSNAGVDEPKIPFSRSGCSNAWCYSLIETKFDEFLRLLPAKNKADMNYGTSTIDFDWNDSRTSHIVNNKVEVTVTPVQSVPFRLMKYSNVAGESGAINAYLSGKDMGWLGPMIRFGVSMANAVIALIYGTVVAIAALAVVLGVIAVALYALATTYTTLATTYYALAATNYALCASCCNYPCFAGCVGCVLGPIFTALGLWATSMAAYYAYAGGMMTAGAIIAGIAAVAFLFIYINNPPGNISCFAWEQRTEHPISVGVTRTTSPSSTNYGVYTTDWPAKTQSAYGTVKDGYIFPPSQNFDIIPNF